MKVLFGFLTLTALLSNSVHAVVGCSKKIKLKTIDTSVYQCDDGTISYNQAYYRNVSQTKKEYNGLCGATAAANVIHAFCQKTFTEPTQLGTNRFSDITPGIRPDTLEAGLNEIFDDYPECPAGEWKYYYTENRWDYLQSLKVEIAKKNSSWKRTLNGKSQTISPVIALIESFSASGVLHYVTVVDVEGYDHKNPKSYLSDKCKVSYNDFGMQSSKFCRDFVRQASNVDNSTLTSWLPEYIHFVFEK